MDTQKMNMLAKKPGKVIKIKLSGRTGVKDRYGKKTINFCRYEQCRKVL